MATTIVYGVTPTGFVKKTLAIIVSELENTYRQSYGNGVNLNPPSLMSIEIGIRAEREAAVWDLEEAAWNARARSTAQGVSLDNVNEITNEQRLKPQPSKILQQVFFGDAGTLIPTSLVLSVIGNSSAKFSPLAPTTLVAGADEVQLITFVAVPTGGAWTITMPDGQETSTLGFAEIAVDIQAAINALPGWEGVTVSGNYSVGFTISFLGTSQKQPWILIVAGGNLNHPASIAITVARTTTGVIQGVVIMQANTDGPLAAVERTLTVIETPVTGLTGTINRTDALPGSLIESDEDYRQRANQDLQSEGATTVEAIRAGLKKVPNVLEVIVYQNNTMTTDGNGVPPKSLHIYVDGGADQDIGDAIWLLAGGGIQTYGGVSVNVTDSQGLTQVVAFDRPEDLPVFVAVTVTKDGSNTYPGDDAVKAAVVAFGQQLTIGQDVLLRPKLYPWVGDQIVGMEDVEILIDFTSTPTGTSNLTIGANQRATFTTSDVTVVSS